MNLDQIFAYFEHSIARDRLAGNKAGLHRLQVAAGVLMEAAEVAADKDTAMRFRVLAAEAANKKEELEPEG